MTPGRKPKRVLVCSSGGVRNMGDDAILLRTAERIRARLRRTRIDVLTDECGSIPGFPALQPVGRNLRADHVAYDCYQLVVIAGGGFVCDEFASHVTARRRVAEHAVAAGVPVVVTGLGVGPMTGSGLVDDLRALADAANGFSVRDEGSQEILAAIDVSSVVTGDDALGLAGDRMRRRVRHPYLALHLRDASYHTTDEDERAAWTHAVHKVAETHDLRVVGVAVNDRPEAPEPATLRSAGIDRIIDATRDPRLAARATRGAIGVVSHSYHVALFALAAGTPAVLATANPYYLLKGEGLRRLTGLSDAIIASEPPDARELADRFDEIRAGLRDDDALARAAQHVDAFFNDQWDRLVTGNEPLPPLTGRGNR